MYFRHSGNSVFFLPYLLTSDLLQAILKEKYPNMKKYTYLLFPAAVLAVLLLLSSCEKSFTTTPQSEDIFVAQKLSGDDNYSRNPACLYYHRLVKSIFGVRCVLVKSNCNCVPGNVKSNEENTALVGLHNALATQTVPHFFDTGDWDVLFPQLGDSMFASYRQGLIDQSYSLIRIDGDSLSNNGDPVEVFEVNDPHRPDSLNLVLLVEIESV